MKHENKCKKKDKKVLPALEEKNLAKILEKTTKNCFGSLDRSNEREKCFEKV